MRVSTCFIFLFFALYIASSGQISQEKRQGEVSFITSNNIYVKFTETQGISIGDVLEVEGKACLKVSSKSSTSCVCVPISECSPKKGDIVMAKINLQTKPDPTIEEPEPAPTTTQTTEEAVSTPALEEEEPLYKERIRGRISLANYSLIGSNRDNRNRLMGRISVDAQHINNSKLSLEAYLSYRQINPVNPENFAPATSFSGFSTWQPGMTSLRLYLLHWEEKSIEIWHLWVP